MFEYGDGILKDRRRFVSEIMNIIPIVRLCGKLYPWYDYESKTDKESEMRVKGAYGGTRLEGKVIFTRVQVMLT